MKWLSTGTAHWLWVKLLIATGHPRRAWRLIRLLGFMRYHLQRRTRETVTLNFQQLAEGARRAGFSAALTNTPPEVITRQWFAHRALLGVAPLLMADAPPVFCEKLIKLEPSVDSLKNQLEGKGLVIAATHYGSMGITPALLVREGLRVVILRDASFRPLLETPHARQFFLGAEPLFLDAARPDSITKTLLSCARALKSGAVIAYTADARHGQHGADTRVLGCPVQLRTALIELAMKTGTPVTYGYSHVEDGRVHCSLAPPRQLHSPDDLAHWAQTMADDWQRMILHHPTGISWSLADMEILDCIKKTVAPPG